MLSGSCLCGAITFTAEKAARDPAACHCTQCRKQTGHHWASVQVLDNDLKITGAPRWYAASETAKRGFCPTCGSFLFWKGKADPDTGVSLGALDGATGLRLERHIFTADKGDYYDIPDTIRQQEQET
ncbi:GFA family protein [Sulfitobacter donghicola]|uniref:Aldehyde-activating protein n=1 Tax=Sulfitobacter donghicola DSW-25 = KCTC 12864 = JCM 14565 TaxID=1300350 RepID=A0A073ILE2_9RHOB|nr:GFA family protein [Sulfitobacter donghicola]KEJ90405.1 aldehyde-activating protein [Sulfitobacter donghicola DSW-25 = KCTC 12864 = JCM 14565]